MYSISKSEEWNKCLNLLLDPEVSEIAANGPNSFFYVKNGQRINMNINLRSEEEFIQGIQEGLVPHVRTSREFKLDGYLFEGRLTYSIAGIEVIARCHIGLPPSTVIPQISIAKKSASLRNLDSIASQGSMSTEMLNFLKMTVKAGMTTVVSGGTGAGKTTMLEAMTKLFPNDYRIAVAEDIPELVLIQPNVTYWEAVPFVPGMDPNEVATLQWVVKQFQRNRNDRVIIGETRGAEFAEFLVAANSGKNGSLTTIHADNPVSCLRKMTNFATQGFNGLNVRSVNTELASAVDIIVQLHRFPDTGRHRVTQIQEVTQTLSNNESASISTQPLYTYDSVTDTFKKEENMTDGLRKLCEQREVDISEFLKSKIGEPVRAHNMLTSRDGAHSTGSRTLGNPLEEHNTPENEQKRSFGRRLPTNNPFTRGR